MKKGTKIALGIVAAVLAVLLLLFAACSVAMNAFSLYKINALEQQLADVTGEYGYGEDPAQEDDVHIAGEYVIKSTLQISDAYRSGSDASLNEKDKETLRMASAVIDEAVTDGMSAYEKEKAVYDWMTTHLSFDEGMLTVVPETGEDSDNPYGVLKYHNAVCVGYATTFRLLMQMLDIPCMVVHNSERGHSWDLVQLDGAWYHVDIYSDEGVTNYSHFNLNDEMMGAYQSWNTDFFPAADATKYCYMVQSAEDIKDIYAIPAKMRKALDGNAPFVAYRVSGDDGQTAEIVNAIFQSVEARASYTEELGAVYFFYSQTAVDGDTVYYCSFEYPNYDDDGYDGYLPDDIQEKVDSAVEKSFSDLTPTEEGYYDGEDY